MIRDDKGQVMGSMVDMCHSRVDSYLAECRDIRRALVFAHESGLRVSSVESDSINAVRAIDSFDEFAVESHVIHDIRKLLSLVSDGSCCFVPRERNKTTHSLAKLVLSISLVRYRLKESPECISHVITSDLLDNT